MQVIFFCANNPVDDHNISDVKKAAHVGRYFFK
jgi:hypothetical protein